MSVIERLLRREDDAETIAGLSIAPMRRRDLRGGVMDIEAVSYPRPWSHGVFESEIGQMRDGSRKYLVARRPGSRGGRPSIVGYAGLWFAAGEGHVTNVAVKPSEQRTGVATALLLSLADAAVDRGCTAWTLEVRVSNEGAIKLYERLGFEARGIRRGYYTDNREDALIMWREPNSNERAS